LAVIAGDDDAQIDHTYEVEDEEEAAAAATAAEEEAAADDFSFLPTAAEEQKGGEFNLGDDFDLDEIHSIQMHDHGVATVDGHAVDLDPAAAAAGEALPPEAARRGRPRRVDPCLNAPVWPANPPASIHSLHQLLSDLFGVAADNNLTEKATNDLFNAVRAHLPVGHEMPSHSHAVALLLRNCPVRLTKYIACPNDCSLYSLEPAPRDESRPPTPCSLDELTLEQIKVLEKAQCDHCGETFCDEKKRIRKVSTTRKENTLQSEHTNFISSRLSPCAAMLTFVLSHTEVFVFGPDRAVENDV
jgi:hypothetical protein